MDALNPMADLPLTPGMALTGQSSAMERFASLSPDQQRDLIDQSLRTTWRGEVRAFFTRPGGAYVSPQDLAP